MSNSYIYIFLGNLFNNCLKLVADAKETGWDVEPSISRVRLRSKPD